MNDRNSGNFWVIAPFVLAVIGTVVMLFTNSANALKVALIFALWAAASGILVIDRVRRDRDRAVATLSEREAALADANRLLNERPEAPTPAPAQAQSPAAAPAIALEDVALLRQLQEEIQALRAQLEEMRGEVFEYEPAAVRASARRIQELEREPKPEPRPGPSSDDTMRITRVTTEKPAATPTVKPAGGTTRRPRPAGAPSAEAIAGRLGQQPSREQPNPLSTLISERTQEAAQEAPKPKPEHKPAPEPKPTPEPTERRGGRRRRDEAGAGSVSVADLLARSKDEDR